MSFREDAPQDGREQPRRSVRPVPAPPPESATRQRSSASSGRRSGSSRTRPEPRPRARRTRRTRRRRPVRNFFRVVFVVLLAWLVFLVGTPVYAWSNTTRIDAMPSGERPAATSGTLWLLVGSDSREGLSAEDRERLGTGDAEGRRTDTMMLLFVPLFGKPALISIPRDSYVTIPGHGRNKINAAYAFGGAPLLIQTIEQNTGLRVDHYAEVGFGGFVNVIDALGGIEMCPKAAIKDHYSRLDIPAGCQIMDGPTALGYVRMRYADPRGDVGRMERQREMVAGIVRKAATPATVLNPLRWWGVNNGAAASLSTGQDTGILRAAGLVPPLMRIARGDGHLVMVPVSSTNTTTSAGSSMIWDEEQSQAMFAEIARGDTSKLDRFAKLPG